jgi:hypothetical protein
MVTQAVAAMAAAAQQVKDSATPALHHMMIAAYVASKQAQVHKIQGQVVQEAAQEVAQGRAQEVSQAAATRGLTLPQGQVVAAHLHQVLLHQVVAGSRSLIKQVL